MKKNNTVLAAWIMVITITMSSLGIYTLFKSTEKEPCGKHNYLTRIKQGKENGFKHAINAAGIYFGEKYLKTWRRGIAPSRDDVKDQRKYFHYNMKIEHIIDESPNVVKFPDRITIYFHGWGDHRKSARLLKAFADVLPGDLITFDFRDKGIGIGRFDYSNFGQMRDVLPAIYAIKWAKDNLNLKAVDLFGYSRGGAVIPNLIAVLNDKTGAYDTQLSEIGIDGKERKELLTIIQRGTLVLNCPLRDMNLTITEFFKWMKPEKAISLVTKFTRYKPEGLQPITSVETFRNLRLKTLIHFQYKDKIVSNKDEAIFYDAIARHNPLTTYLVLGDDGGHLHTQDALSRTLHRFHKKYNAAYDTEYTECYEASKPETDLSAQLLQPKNLRQAETMIANFHAACAQAALDKKKKRH